MPHQFFPLVNHNILSHLLSATAIVYLFLWTLSMIALASLTSSDITMLPMAMVGFLTLLSHFFKGISSAPDFFFPENYLIILYLLNDSSYLNQLTMSVLMITSPLLTGISFSPSCA
jgi:hypothetical protein